MSNIEVGKVYKINHSRKGVFNGRILKACDVWATCEIVTGAAGAIADRNKAGKGEELTLRQSLATFTEL